MGPETMARWCGTCGIPDGARVILAGIAGGLSGRVDLREAVVVDEVVGKGGPWRPSRAPRNNPPVRLVTVHEIVETTEAKLALAERMHADLVDMEAEPFILHAQAHGWDWDVVRGVSDGPHDRLPREIGSWIAADGGTRYGRIISSLLRRPSDIPPTIRMARHTTAAMREVAKLIRAMEDKP
jgi:hypothetical protein